MSYQVRTTSRFRKDYKKMKKRGMDISKLQSLVDKLARGEELPPQNHDHALTGNYAGTRECHITPDWLLVYYVENDILVLTLSRTGSHSDLFD